jgi:hypothetical protein
MHENQFYNPNAADLSEVLVGRKVVRAESGDFTTTHDRRTETYEGRLLLDDGTTLLARGNTGGCICGAGDYPLESLSTVDNVITKVEVEANPGGDMYDEYIGSYRIFGNGYYGTGFEIEVVPA